MRFNESYLRTGTCLRRKLHASPSAQGVQAGVRLCFVQLYARRNECRSVAL
jgi:hypothetical protein